MRTLLLGLALALSGLSVASAFGPTLDVAVFEDADPYGSGALATALANVGSTPTFFTSSDMGVADLSGFDKVVIAGAQDAAFHAAFQANAAYFASFVASGGTLEIHAAAATAEPWTGAVWDGVGYADAPTESVAVLDPAHAILSVPHPVASGDLQAWSYSANGHFTGAQSWTVVIAHDPSGEPVWIEQASGAGCVFMTTQPVEWTFASADFLENNLATLGCTGIAPPVPELPALALASAGLVGLAIVLRRSR